MTDPDFLIAFKNGDYEAFEQVYRLYNKRLFFFAWGFVGKEDAEDIVVESFVNLTRGLDNNFHSLGEIKMFLYTVAINQCARHLKDAKGNATSNKEIIYLMERNEDFIQSKIIRAECMNLTHEEM